jgi:hypothetical protein
MVDPLTASITIILGKYALDKGAELAKEVGPTALEKAREIAVTALDRLRCNPADRVIADEFEKEPETYQKPLEKKLEEAMKDPDFAARPINNWPLPLSPWQRPWSEGRACCC